MTLTAAQTQTLICSEHLQIEAGLELLDTSSALIEDISDDLISGTVERQNFLDVHATLRCQITGERDWPNVRLRPYQILTAGALSEKYYRGVYVPSRPAVPLNKEPAIYDLTALDLLSLLTDEIGDSYEVAASTGYLAALRTLIGARVSGATCLFDATSEATVLAAALNWTLTPSAPSTYLGGPCRDLTKGVGYNALWTDALGNFRTEPWQDPRTKTPIWTLDVSNQATDITLPDRTLAEERATDSRASINYWRFWMTGTSTLPSEGTTQYTVDRSAGGTKHRSSQGLSAADYASLVAAGDQIVQEDSQVLRTLNPPVRALPLLGHLDVIGYKGDPRVGDALAQVRSYRIPLRPQDGPTTLTLEILL